MTRFADMEELDIETLRKTEYPMLRGEVYLDHTGTTLYSQSALQAFMSEMSSHLFGNPHSQSRSSQLSTARIDDVRKRTLEFFHADPEYFDLVFVQNATAAVKLVVEALKTSATANSSKESSTADGLWFGYHVDSHTSIIGIRELANAGHHCFGSDDEVASWIKSRSSRPKSGRCPGQTTDRFDLGLFAYPGQSNMTGRRLPMGWPRSLQRLDRDNNQTIFTLLDAAALASTAELDFSNPEEAPDFTAVSFYKIFGFPDLGALIVRKKSAHVLQQRSYFGGGTVEMVVCSKDPWHSMHIEQVHEALEDGTLPFHNIIALGCALSAHQQLYGSQKNVSVHTTSLVAMLYEGMSSLRHPNGTEVCKIYQDSPARYGDCTTQGPIIAFNVQSDDGRWLKLSELEQAANEHHIHLRTGDVCNPGGVAKVLNLQPWESLRNFTAGVRCGCKNVLVGYKPSGIARVSVGAMSTMQDVEKFVTFLHQLYGSGAWINAPLSPPIQPSALSLQIYRIMVYPIRGCCAFSVPDAQTWQVTPLGLQWDRQWCLINLKNREIITQKICPRLFLIHPEVDIRKRVLRVKVHRSLRKCQVLQNGIEIPLGEGEDDDFPTEAHGSDKEVEMTIWDRGLEKETHIRLMPSTEIATFFTMALGVPCTLGKILNAVSLKEPSGWRADKLPRINMLTGMDDLESDRITRLDGQPAGVQPPPTLRNSRLAVGLAETLRVNVLLASGIENSDPQWHYLRIGKRFQTGGNDDGHQQDYHLGQMKALEVTAERRSPESFSGISSLKRIVWDSGHEFVSEACLSIRPGQMVHI